jgi:hypothetical protein
MREFAKSMARYGWAMSVFGVQQMVNLMNPQNSTKTADSFNSVADAAAATLGPNLKSAYQTGDKMQSQFVDAFMGMGGNCMGMGMMDPNRWMKMGSEMMQGAEQAAQQAAGRMGCGGSRSSAAPAGPPPAAPPAAPGSATSGGAAPGTAQTMGWGPMPH